jgi:hypothetical protein
MSILNNMAGVVEFSGVPASGKSTIIKRNEYVAIKISQFFPFLERVPEPLLYFIEDAILLVIGYRFLSFKELFYYIGLSFNEDVSIFYKLNIIRNVLKKYAVYSLSLNSSQDGAVYVDEGVSHIPFNFLNADIDKVVSVIRPHLKNISVKYIYLENDHFLRERLGLRGHARLKFESIDNFIKKNRKVETHLLSMYPVFCNTFEILKND